MVVRRFDENESDIFKNRISTDIYSDIERAFFFVIGAIDDEGNPVGVLVCEIRNAEDDSHREGHIIQINADSSDIYDALFLEYSDFVRERKIVRSVYEFFDDDNTAIMREAGFSVNEGVSENIIVTLGDILRIPIASGRRPVPSNVGSIARLQDRQYRKGIMKCLMNNRKGLVEDLAYIPMDWFECDISSYTELDGEVNSYLLIRKVPSGQLQVKLLFGSGPDSKKSLLYMIINAIRSAAEKYPEDTEVLIRCETHAAKALCKKLLPDKSGVYAVWGDRKE